MALEFNVTEAEKFFFGEDKSIDLEILGADEVTPLDMTGIPLEWSLKKKDKDLDPPILDKTTANGGITIVGVYNADPAMNTQRVRITFVPADTNPIITSALPTPYALKAKFVYRHSLKRIDVGNKSILVYGSFTFLQATEP